MALKHGTEQNILFINRICVNGFHVKEDYQKNKNQEYNT